MSLSEAERQIIVKMEMEKAQRTLVSTMFDQESSQRKTEHCFQTLSLCETMQTIIAFMKQTRKNCSLLLNQPVSS